MNAHKKKKSQEIWLLIINMTPSSNRIRRLDPQSNNGGSNPSGATKAFYTTKRLGFVGASRQNSHIFNGAQTNRYSHYPFKVECRGSIPLALTIWCYSSVGQNVGLSLRRSGVRVPLASPSAFPYVNNFEAQNLMERSISLMPALE